MHAAAAPWEDPDDHGQVDDLLDLDAAGDAEGDPAAAAAMAADIFKIADASRNASLTMLEMETYLRGTPHYPFYEWLRAARSKHWREVDADGSASLEPPEVEVALVEFLRLERAAADNPAVRRRGKALRQITRRLTAAMNANSSKFETPSWYKIFKEYDRDGSGKLDQGEIEWMVRKGLKMPRDVVSRSELALLWNMLDADGNGLVDVQEFASFMRRMQDGTHPALATLTGTGAVEDFNVEYADMTTAERLQVEDPIANLRNYKTIAGYSSINRYGASQFGYVSTTDAMQSAAARIAKDLAVRKHAKSLRENTCWNGVPRYQNTKVQLVPYHASKFAGLSLATKYGGVRARTEQPYRIKNKICYPDDIEFIRMAREAATQPIWFETLPPPEDLAWCDRLHVQPSASHLRRQQELLLDKTAKGMGNAGRGFGIPF